MRAAIMLELLRDIRAGYDLPKPNQQNRYICQMLHDAVEKALQAQPHRSIYLRDTEHELVKYIEAGIENNITLSSWLYGELGHQGTPTCRSGLIFQLWSGTPETIDTSHADYNELIRMAWLDRMIHSLQTEGKLP